jgi:hypothetical protein
MAELKNFEPIGTRAFYRPVAECTLEKGADMIAEAIKAAREQGLVDIIVNTTGLTGFEPPTLFQRYAFVTKWAQSAGTALRVAIVTRAEFIDPQRMGVVMMQNRGTTNESFLNELDALKWLDARQPTRARPSGDRAHPKD